MRSFFCLKWELQKRIRATHMHSKTMSLIFELKATLAPLCLSAKIPKESNKETRMKYSYVV
jgi:hypothetical protein